MTLQDTVWYRTRACLENIVGRRTSEPSWFRGVTLNDADTPSRGRGDDCMQERAGVTGGGIGG